MAEQAHWLHFLPSLICQDGFSSVLLEVLFAAVSPLVRMAPGQLGIAPPSAV